MGNHGPLQNVHVASAQNPVITVQLKQSERERERERERGGERENESVKI